MSGRCIRSPPISDGAARRRSAPARLLGALECLRNGITTLQDMNSLVPQDEETLDTILSAYAEIGIRVVFSIAVRDVGALDIAAVSARRTCQKPPWPSFVAPRRTPREEIAFVERQIKRLTPLPPRLTWGLSPSGPQRSSRALLEGVGDLARSAWAADLHPCVRDQGADREGAGDLRRTWRLHDSASGRRRTFDAAHHDRARRLADAGRDRRSWPSMAAASRTTPSAI